MSLFDLNVYLLRHKPSGLYKQRGSGGFGPLKTAKVTTTKPSIGRLAPRYNKPSGVYVSPAWQMQPLDTFEVVLASLAREIHTWQYTPQKYSEQAFIELKKKGMLAPHQ